MPDSLPYTPALEGRTLLDELNHRIKNELASVINLVTFKAVWTDNVEAKEELSNVVDLLHQHVQVDRGGPANFRGVEGRIAASGANSYVRNSYAGHGYGRGYRYGTYAAAAAAYAYGRSYASSDDDCYYVSAYGRNGTYRRVLRCGGN